MDVPVIESGPESLLGVADLREDAGTIRGSIPTGPWLTGADRRIGLGALGVLVDNVLGFAIIAQRPADHWSVSTEISIDLMAPISLDGGRLHASSRLVGSGATGGLALGEVRDDDGRLVAVGRQRGRFVAVTPRTGTAETRFDDVAATSPSLESLLTARRAPSGLTVDVGPRLQNPMHNLHGGVTLALADLAATVALHDGGADLVTTSIHTVYVRGVPAEARLDVRATVQHRGRTLGAVEVIGSVAGRTCTISQVTAAPPPT